MRKDTMVCWEKRDLFTSERFRFGIWHVSKCENVLAVISEKKFTIPHLKSLISDTTFSKKEIRDKHISAKSYFGYLYAFSQNAAILKSRPLTMHSFNSFILSLMPSIDSEMHQPRISFAVYKNLRSHFTFLKKII